MNTPIQIIQWFPDDSSIVLQEALNKKFSVGIHPCQMHESLSEQVKTIESLAWLPQIVAIGETGLDKTCSFHWALQMIGFKELALIAEQVQKPLIIHCVKAWQEIIAFRRELNPSIPWIIHGFRGKPELAQSLLKEGIFLSFGARFNEDSLKKTPLEQLCIETDESALPLETIYETIASVKQLPVSILSQKANVPFHVLRSASNDALIDVHTHLSSK